ncbi:hypothetical protein LOK46_06795 [Methylobacterium sp. NMS14P]|uniref:hypothetical protein n=1 Tax=Methylobacterium sp. NMS14P TaxID=2894310 RepID=UPI0023591ECF|nr:hypothetical protein [Methylobacterium sp. NMS14P]WCS26538.1 hypothetical protein LOK46_06795 [Methylobacterium sp. NMS14P]
MFDSEIKIEVERRLQKACDDRAREGLPPPVSVDALRAVVRSDLLREVEAARVRGKAATVKTIAALKPTLKATAPSLPKPKPASPQSATGRLIELAEKMDLREPVFPSLREPARKPALVVDPAETAAQAILRAGRIARGG